METLVNKKHLLDWRRFPYIFIQGVAALFIFTAPGVAAIDFLFPAFGAAQPLAVKLGAAFVLSSLAVAAAHFLIVKTPPPFPARLARLLCLAMALYLVFGGGFRCLTSWFLAASGWETLSVALTLALTLEAFALMPLNKYPILLSEDMGEWPLYYTSAMKAALPREKFPSCMIGDFPDGRLPYIDKLFIPRHTTGFLFQVFGVNWHSMNLINAAANYFFIAALAPVAALGAPPGHGSFIFAVTLVLCSLPRLYVFAGIGAHTLPGYLGFAVVMALFFPGAPAGAGTVALAALMLIYMMLSRPETSLLAFLTAAALLLAWIFSLSVTAGFALLLGAAALTAAVWIVFPRLYAARLGQFRSFWVAYLRYDRRRGRFRLMYDPWVNIHRTVTELNFGGKDSRIIPCNENFGSELRAHPFSFLWMLLVFNKNFTGILWQSIFFLNPLFFFLTGILLFYFTVIMSLIFSKLAFFCLVICVMVFLLPLANCGCGLRHLCGGAAVVFVVFLSVFNNLRIPDGTLFALVCFFVSAHLLNLFKIIQIRLLHQNTLCSVIMDELIPFANKGYLIASCSPQLPCCILQLDAMGTSFFTEYLSGVLKFKPDIILIDNMRSIPGNYSFFFLNEPHRMKMGGRAVPGYKIYRHNYERDYMIMTREGLPAV